MYHKAQFLSVAFLYFLKLKKSWAEPGLWNVFFPNIALVPFATFYDCLDALWNFWKLPWCPKFLQKVKAKLPCPFRAEVSGKPTLIWDGYGWVWVWLGMGIICNPKLAYYKLNTGLVNGLQSWLNSFIKISIHCIQNCLITFTCVSHTFDHLNILYIQFHRLVVLYQYDMYLSNARGLNECSFSHGYI